MTNRRLALTNEGMNIARMRMYEITPLGQRDLDLGEDGILSALEFEPKNAEQLLSELEMPEDELREKLGILINSGCIRRTSISALPEPREIVPPTETPRAPEVPHIMGEMNQEELSRMQPPIG